MKLPEIKIEIDGSDNFTEETFSVGNAGLIFDILRNKLYSDAIQSICREYSSNARDAHREIGTFDKPIEIHFPNAFDSNFIIKDYGTGISKNRMSDVFIKYGNSTKRNDNVQLGAYGCGAKSAYSYTNSFSIVTIAKENGINTKCTYIAYLDDTNAGKMRLVSEEITTEPTGTSIVIPVQDKDVQAFIDGTLKSTQYWPVRPLLFGLNPLPEWPSSVGELLAEGTESNWKIYNVANYNRWNRSKAESLAIIDGIQYKINETFVNIDDRWLLACNVHMYFDIGQLTLSASRENLQYDENTKYLINKRLKDIQKELSEQIINILNKKESYVEAVEFYNFMNKYFYKALDKRDLTWQGHKIIGSEIQIHTDILNKINGSINSYSEHRSRKTGNFSIRKTDSDRIFINSSTEVYFNDLNPKHIYRNKHVKALQSYKCIQIINYVKGKSYDDFVKHLKSEYDNYINSPEYVSISSYYKYNDNSWIFDVIKPKLLSSIIEDKIPTTPKIKKPKVIDKVAVKKLYSVAGRLQNCFYNVNLDINAEGYYVECDFKNGLIWTTHKDEKWQISFADVPSIKVLLSDEGVDLFSVKEKDLKKLTKLKPLSEFLEKQFNKISNTNLYKNLALDKVLNSYHKGYYQLYSNIDGLNTKAIKSKDSLINLYFDRRKDLKVLISIDFLNRLEIKYKNINVMDQYLKDAEDLLNQMKSRYGLLSHISINADRKDIIDYINYCDEKYNQKQEILKTGT